MIRTLILATVVTCTCTAAAAAAPQRPPDPQSSTTRLVPFSGVLTDAKGTALPGVHTVTMGLFDQAEGGTLLWTDTQTVSADVNGRYLAYLGAGLPLAMDIFRTEQARWLQVSINGRDLQRVMLVAVPYALRAADAETLGGTPASSFVVTGADGKLQRADGGPVEGAAVDGTGVANQLAKWSSGTTLSSSIVTESGANQLGIGTTDPTEGGQFESKVTIRATDGLTALGISNQAGTPRFALNTNADGSWITYDRSSGEFRPGIAQRDGRIGIAMTDPTAGGVVDSKFTVRNVDNNTGIAVVNTSNARRFALNTLATGGWTTYDGGGGTWNQGFTQIGGRVGLGTTTPAAGFFTNGKLVVIPVSDYNAIFARKVVNDTFQKAIHARSDAGISGPIIAGIAGLNDNTDFGGDAGVLGANSNANGRGVWGRAGTTGAGVYGSGGTFAGQFLGNVDVSGTLTKGGGAFRIDHPLDPANKYLQHSFVESPDMMNVYNGNVMLDGQGEAWVTLPDWFEALNGDFRYQLTSIGAPGPNLHVASKIAGNRFRIAGGAASAEVSWQVTGIRQDVWANANRITVESEKPTDERGFFIHPQLFGLAPSMAVPSLRADEGTVRTREVRQDR